MFSDASEFFFCIQEVDFSPSLFVVVAWWNQVWLSKGRLAFESQTRQGGTNGCIP